MSKEEQKKVPPLQRAWACGVFEAKATLRETQNTVSIDSYNEPMLQRFAEIVGHGKVTQAASQKMRQWRYITTSLDDSRSLILFVLPLLSPNKATQASLLLRRIENNPIWQKKFPEKVASLVTVPAK